MSDDILHRLMVKPQLTRKRQVISIPQEIHSKQKTTVIQNVSIQKTKKKETQPQQLNQAVSPRAAKAIIQKQTQLKKQEINKVKTVRHITPDITAYEQTKIRNIRGVGTGKVLVIVGNGPSIRDVPLQMLHGHPNIDIMSINKPDDRAWPSAYWAFFDQSQLRRHRALFDSYSGVVFNSASIKEQRHNTIKLKNLGGFGFSLDLARGMHIGRSSVYAAMQIGLWLGHKHIYVLGCDMCAVDGMTHFYGVNPDAPPDIRLARFNSEAEYYDDAAQKLDDETKKRFTFCSSHNPYGFVNMFNRLHETEAAPRILECARQ